MRSKISILITGGNSYIAKSIIASLSRDDYKISSISRDDFDLTDPEKTKEFFRSRWFDVVIHTAIKGGSRLTKDDGLVTNNNLMMYYNLLYNRHYYGRFINIGSGLEISDPLSFYGISKRVIRDSVLEEENFYNLRVFGIFDENELSTRFIKTCITNYIQKKPIYIHENKKMDFFYMKDFITLLDHYMNNKLTALPKEIDCCYSSSYTLYKIAKMVNNLSNRKTSIVLQKYSTSNDYCGTYTPLLDYIGLKKSIKYLYEIGLDKWKH
jgi:dTDP-4-dehydrorhamnose reductase